MRTASFGDDTRFIVVRHLDLGRVSPRATATAWSQKLESTYRAVQPAAVRYDSPAADRADAVYFAHRHEPWLALAERTAKGERCSDWFWRAAVPAWRPPQSHEATLRLCFRSLAEQGGLALTLTLGLRLKARGVLPALLRVLQTPDFETLKHELKSLATPPANAMPTATVAEAEFLSFWGVADLRTRWLAAVAAADNASFLLQPSPLAPSLPGVVEQVVIKSGPPAPTPLPALPAPATPRPAPRLPSWNDDRLFTHAGGLFFVLPLLARAGLPEHVQRLPDAERAALPWHLLRAIARLARTPDDDPLVVALAATPKVPGRLAPWLLATHRLSLRTTGLTLRQLVARPALITLSPTHVDVSFRPGDADIRIRRAGLDLNPGWVPWLARVVSFHFNRED